MATSKTHKRLFRSWSGWLWDWIIEHWVQIVWVGGASVMTYLASALDWLNKYGPVAWGAVGLCTYLLFTAGYALYGYGRSKIAITRFSEHKADCSSVNPLDDVFIKKQINLSDFFHPFYQPHKNRKFQDCEMYGPATILVRGCKFDDNRLFDCEAVISLPKIGVVGVTAFEYCVFERCKFFRVTFIMTKDAYINFKTQGFILPIISDGNAGEL